MQAIGCQRKSSVFSQALLLALLLINIDACKKDSSSPTSPSTSSSSLTGHWVGTGHVDYGPTVYAHDCSVVGDIAQTAGSLGGNWLWTITASTAGSQVVGHRTRMWFEGQVISSNVISLEETSFVAENWNGNGFETANYSATLSATKDTIHVSNVLPPTQVYPIMTAVIVKQ